MLDAVLVGVASPCRCGNQGAFPFDRRCPAVIDLPTLFNWLFQTAVAVSTITFSIIFHTPKRNGFAALTLPGRGLAGVSRLHASEHWGGGGLFLCHSGPGLVLPRVRFLAQGPGDHLPGLRASLPPVPGAGIYYTGYHLFSERQLPGSDKGLRPSRSPLPLPWALVLCRRFPPFSSPCAGCSPKIAEQALKGAFYAQSGSDH